MGTDLVGGGAVCGSCRSDLSFAAHVVLLAWVGGLTFFARMCDFGSFLLKLLLAYTCLAIASVCNTLSHNCVPSGHLASIPPCAVTTAP